MITTSTLTRAQLRDLTEELQAERARTARALGAHPDGGDGVAAAGALADDEAASRSIAEERHDAILEALARLDDGSYGVCAGCAQPIPYGRLLVMPETKHCVTCGARA
jgi:RNA polymerase-binding transcription factor DksA